MNNKNVTQNKLNEMWNLLDIADGNLYEVIEIMRSTRLVEKKDRQYQDLIKLINNLDMSGITRIKNLIEDMINEKKPLEN